MTYLSPGQIRAWQPDPPRGGREEALAEAHRAMACAGCAGAAQQMGGRWPIGCVALEITQRCNLDCTLCYLSEHSEAVRDLPLEEVFRRIDLIGEHYGAGVDVQITGGDPTLRPRDELLAITRRLTDQGQRSTLMTNGVKATRALLADLADAGLSDVAFHVDTTQERKGYATEVELCRLREAYLERTRGLGLSIMFNTSVHGGNLHEVPVLVRWFVEHADVVRTASFQLQADTGRGTLRGRPGAVSSASVWQAIERGAGAALTHDATLVGHPRCSRYGLALVAGGRAFDAFDEPALIARFQAATAHLALDRCRPWRTLGRFAAWLLAHPWVVGRSVGWALRHARAMSGSFLRGRGRLDTLSFLVHDFMHARALERERIEACVFKVMTGEGPLSMCLHNARRDDFILAPVPLGDGARLDPLSGRRLPSMSASVAPPDPAHHGLKRVKGHTRRRLMNARG